MDDTGKLIADLSTAEKRALLARLIEEKASKPKLYPASFAQQRMWALWKIDPGNPTYNIFITVRVRDIDISTMDRVLNEIVRRHAVLRTTFAMVDGQTMQVVAPTLSLPVPAVDLRVVPDAEREVELNRMLLEEVRRPFDLAHGPLLRARLFSLDNHDHVLTVSMHHSISDGWSLNILIRELSTLYRAFHAGAPSPLPELSIQYADYAVWQRDLLKGEPQEKALAYWKDQLAGVPARLELPTDHPRPPIQTFHGAHQSMTLTPPFSAALKALSQREGVTLFMTLLAAFKTLLYRYSGQTDIAVGTPIANRTHVETEALIGFFVNTLVMRTSLDGSLSFRELLGRVRTVALGAYDHQDLPFEQLLNAVKPERDLSTTPLFQVFFVLQSQNSLAGQSYPSEGLSVLQIDDQIARFDLSITMEDTDQGLMAVFEYNTDLFDATTIQRMTGHFRCLLERIVAQPATRLAELPLLAEAERQQQLIAWNPAPADWLPPADVLTQIIALAERHPDAVALDCGGTQLTYGALVARAIMLAHTLRRHGVGPEVHVGLCLERSCDLVVGLLGILAAGGAYVPLDPSYPPARLAFILQDAQIALLLTQRTLAATLPRRAAPAICLDTDWPMIADAPPDATLTPPAPADLAYVIYTSGSTGQPKGVQVEHSQLSQTMRAIQQTWACRRDDVAVWIASVSFDIALFELLVPLLAGARVRIIARPQDEDPAGWRSVLEGCTWLHAVPSLLRQLVQVCAEDPTGQAGRALRQVFVGGEAVPPELLAQLRATLPAAAVAILYGPTETTIICCMAEPGTAVPAQPLIGRPLPHVQIRLYDDYRQLVPVGVAGQLYIGGAGVSRGYLHRPDLTAERFISNPFAEGMGDGGWGMGGESSIPHPPSSIPRLYRTGDRARYLPDGRLVFLGRLDEQVKLRGFRIELGEIEALLEQHPAVRASVVILREDVPGLQRLVAYVVQGSGVRGQGSGRQGDKETGDDAAVTQNSKLKTQNYPPPQSPIPNPQSLIPELRAFLQERLPGYMVPTALVVLDHLPLTAHGKVDRRALPTPEAAGDVQSRTLAAPQTPFEELLAGIWAKVLGRDRVGIHDNFFEVGGDSIVSLQIIARAQQAGIRITQKHIFQYPTIAELSQVVGSSSTARAEQGLVTGPLPLTPIQHRFFEQHFSHPQHYNQAVLVDAQQRLDPTILERVVDVLLAHHDSLRLRFRQEQGEWRQIGAGRDAEVPFTHVDLAAFPANEQQGAIERTIAALQASLDLANGPLLRVAFFQRGETGPDCLALIVHHLAIDHVSWPILLEDLHTVYLQLSRSEPPALPAKTTSFKEWAERLSGYAHSIVVQQEQRYWLTDARARVRRLPVDFPDARVHNDEASAQIVTAMLNVEETQTLLQEAPRAYNTRIDTILLAALAQTLADWTGGSQVLIDLEGHGREELFEDDVDLSRTVGWFTTIYPALIDLRDAVGSDGVVRSVKDQLRQVPRHGIGYGVLRFLSPDPSIRAQLRALPQAEVAFNYLGQAHAAWTADALFGPPRLAPGSMQAPDAHRGHLLLVTASVSDGQLAVHWSYSQNLHRRTTIGQLTQTFMERLRMLTSPGRATDAGNVAPSDFPLANLDNRKLQKISNLLAMKTGHQKGQRS